MGMDGDYTNITLVTRCEDSAKKEVERIDNLPYEEYNWYSSGMESHTV